MNGIYQEFGTLRSEALKLAAQTFHGEEPERIVAAAELYYAFLATGE